MVPAGFPGCDFKNWLPEAAASCTPAHSLQLCLKLAVVRPGKGPIRSLESLKTSFIRKRATRSEALHDVAEIFCPFSDAGSWGLLRGVRGLF